MTAFLSYDYRIVFPFFTIPDLSQTHAPDRQFICDRFFETDRDSRHPDYIRAET